MAEAKVRLNVQLLLAAERQFKLAVAVRGHCAVAGKSNAYDYLSVFSFGKHVATDTELSLSPEEEKFASADLEYSATYVMATQLDAVLQSEFKDRFKHPNSLVQHASWIARLVRNAFAHDPLGPTWQFYPECENKIFRVENTISLNTAGLHGKPVNRLDYGGPLALLRLSAFVREHLLAQPANPTVERDARKSGARPSP